MSYSFSQHARAMLHDAENALAGRRNRNTLTPTSQQYQNQYSYKHKPDPFGTRRAIEPYESHASSPGIAADTDWLAEAAGTTTTSPSDGIHKNHNYENDAEAAVHALQRQLRHVMNDVIELRQELAAEREGRGTLVRSLMSRCKEEILAELRSTSSTSSNSVQEMSEMMEQMKGRLRSSEEQHIITRRQVDELRRTLQVKDHTLRDRDVAMEEELRELREKITVITAQSLAAGVDQAQQQERLKAELSQRLDRELQRYSELRQADQRTVREAGALFTRNMAEAQATVTTLVHEALSKSNESVAAAVKNDLTLLTTTVEQHSNTLQSLEQSLRDGLRQVHSEAHLQSATVIERLTAMETNTVSLQSRIDRAERNGERAQEIVARGEATVSVAQELAARADKRAQAALSIAQSAEQTVLDREARLQQVESRLQGVVSAEQMRAEVEASRHAVSRVETNMEALRAMCTRSETLAEKTSQSVEQVKDRVAQCEQSVRQGIQWQEKTSAALAVKEEHMKQLTSVQEQVAAVKEQSERSAVKLAQSVQTLETQSHGVQERQQRALQELTEQSNQLTQRITEMTSGVTQVEAQSESTRRSQEWLEKRMTALESSARTQSSAESELRLNCEELKAHIAELRRQQREMQSAAQSREARLQSGLDALHGLENSFATQCTQLENKLRTQISAWLKEYREQQHSRIGAQLQDAEQRQATLTQKAIQDSLRDVEAEWMKALNDEVQRGQRRLESCEQRVTSVKQDTLDMMEERESELRGQVEKALRELQSELNGELQALKSTGDEDTKEWRRTCDTIQVSLNDTQEEQAAMKATLEQTCTLVEQVLQRLQANEQEQQREKAVKAASITPSVDVEAVNAALPAKDSDTHVSAQAVQGIPEHHEAIAPPTITTTAVKHEEHNQEISMTGTKAEESLAAANLSVPLTLAQPISTTTDDNEESNRTVWRNEAPESDLTAAAATPLPRLSVRQFHPIAADTTSSTATSATARTTTTSVNEINNGNIRGEQEEKTPKSHTRSSSSRSRISSSNAAERSKEEQTLQAQPSLPVADIRPQVRHISLTPSTSETSGTNAQQSHNASNNIGMTAEPQQKEQRTNVSAGHRSRPFLDVETDFTLTSTTSEPASGHQTPSSQNNNNNSNPHRRATRTNSSSSEGEDDERHDGKSTSQSRSSGRSHHSVPVSLSITGHTPRPSQLWSVAEGGAEVHNTNDKEDENREDVKSGPALTTISPSPEQQQQEVRAAHNYDDWDDDDDDDEDTGAEAKQEEKGDVNANTQAAGNAMRPPPTTTTTSTTTTTTGSLSTPQQAVGTTKPAQRVASPIPNAPTQQTTTTNNVKKSTVGVLESRVNATLSHSVEDEEDEESEGPLRNESVPTHGHTTTSSSSSAETHTSLSRGRQGSTPTRTTTTREEPAIVRAVQPRVDTTAIMTGQRVYTNFDDSSSASESEGDGPAT